MRSEPLDFVQDPIGESWRRLDRSTNAWLKALAGCGRADVERICREVLEGRTRRDEGHTLAPY